MANNGSSDEATVLNGQFAQLMAAFQASQDRFDRRFSEFQAEVRQGQEDAAAKALKRVRRDKPYPFKRKGNEEQATFNDKVDEAMAEAQAELTQESGSAPSIQRAHDALATGRKLLAERQKLIRIAD
jgi:gas vesicle protein